MTSFKMLLSVFLVAGFSAQAEVSSELKAQLTAEMKLIGSIYQNQYAPKQWKERHLGWSVERELNTALTKIDAATSVQEYRAALKDFVASTQDYHVSVSFFATERASLAFQVKTVEGKTLIVDVNRKKLSQDAFPFSAGDELLAIDGKPVSEILKELQAKQGLNVPGTDAALADLFLTGRSARANLKVPQGPVLLTLQRAKDKEPTTFQLVWDYQKELAPGSMSDKKSILEIDEPKSKAFDEKPMMMSAHAQPFMEADRSWGIGQRTSFLPQLGEKVWQSADDSIFDAYIYLNAQGKLVGVVRIPSYLPADTDAALKEMAALLEKFEKQTSALVIDQVNNPGGSVFYLYALVSMLVKDSVTTPQHKMNLNLADVNNAASMLKELSKVTNDKEAKETMGENFSGFPVTYQLVVNIRGYSQFILDQWAAGKRLTDPHYIYGVDMINPHNKVKYTKPIVVLVNELDFSGGDFFPAILQDNKRVTIVGTRTAGAGGYVRPVTFPNSFGFQNLTLTGSIAERIDRNPIENLGVTPDVALKVTVEDIAKNFEKYLGKVRETVDSLIK